MKLQKKLFLFPKHILLTAVICLTATLINAQELECTSCVIIDEGEPSNLIIPEGTSRNITDINSARITIDPVTGEVVVLDDHYCITMRPFSTLIINHNTRLENVSWIPREGARILIKEGVKLTGQNVNLHGCQKMWKGIVLEDAARVDFDNVEISDAEYALDIEQDAFLELNNITFNKNYVGINAGLSFPAHDIKFSSKNDNVVFDCSSALLPSYSGQFPATDGISSAGMSFTTTVAIDIGVPEEIGTYTFNNLLNGIQLFFGTSIRADGLVFKNINRIPEPTDVNFFGQSNGRAIYMWRTPGAVLENLDFDQCDYGIESINSSINVLNSTFDNGIFGIFETTEPFFGFVPITASLISNNTFRGTPGAIYYQNVERKISTINGQNDFFSSNRWPLTNLDFSISHLVTMINVQPLAESHNSIKDNNFQCGDQGGVKLSETSFTKIGSNVFNSSNIDDYEYGTEFGVGLVALCGAQNNLIEDNIFKSIPDDGITDINGGVFARMSENNTYCDNEFYMETSDMVFDGENEDSDLIGNDISGSGNGLIVGGFIDGFPTFGQIGIQERRENKFRDTYNNGIGALNLNTIEENVLASQFIVKEFELYDYPGDDEICYDIKSNITGCNLPFEWFREESGPSNSTCNGAGIINSITESNLYIINTGLDGNGIYDVQDYLAKLRIMEKMIAYPNLISFNTSTQNFYNTYKNTAMKKLAIANLAYGVLRRAGIANLTSCQTNSSNLKAQLDDLKTIALNFKNGTITETAYINALNSTFASITNFKENLDNLESLNSTDFDTKLNTYISVVSALSGYSDPYISRCYDVYMIELEAINNNGVITSSSLQSLKNIAVLCPLEDGDVVYKAFNLFNALHPTDRLADIDDCRNVSSSQSNIETESSILQNSVNNFSAHKTTELTDLSIDLFPNPSTDQLMVNLPKSFQGLSIQYNILNAQGKLIDQGKLRSSGRQESFNISKYPDGLYWLFVYDQNGHQAEAHFLKMDQ